MNNRRTVFLHITNSFTSRDENIIDGTIAKNRHIKLGVLIPCQVLSILCSLFVFINMIQKPSKLVKPINNHFIVVLMVTSFIQVTTELSMVENFLDTGVIRPSTNSYCLFFNWYEFSLNGMSLFVMLWACVERHMIVFSRSIFRVWWRRMIFHYIPLSMATLYTPLFYAFMIFVYDCANDWDYHELLCTAPCFYKNKVFGIFDWLANIIMPAFLIASVNLLLIIRVVYFSAGVRVNVERAKKNRKMTIQLLAVSLLFLIFWLPIAVTGLIQQFFNPTFLIDVQFNVFFYLIYFIQLFLPFVCFISLPPLKRALYDKVRRWKSRNAVGDATIIPNSFRFTTIRY